MGRTAKNNPWVELICNSEATPVEKGSSYFRVRKDFRRRRTKNRIRNGSILRAHLERLDVHDYFAILAYLQMNSTHDEHLQRIRMAVRDQYRVATCLGFGPRFLHSTGQAYKGGPNSGVFLQITGDDESDLQVSGHRYTFGVVKAAQAGGELHVLNQRGRRVLRVHLPQDNSAGLIALTKGLLAH